MPMPSPAPRPRLLPGLSIASILTAGCLLLSLIGTAAPRPAVAQPAGQPGAAMPADLAAMVPTVDDLRDAGLGSFFAFRSRELRADEDQTLPELSAATAQTLRDAGYVGGYSRDWVSDARADTPGGNRYPAMLASTGLGQYRDNDGGTAGFDVAAPNGRPLDRPIGDRALLVEQSQRLGDVQYRDERVVFQRGGLVGEVTVSVQEGDHRAEVAARLAETLAERFVRLIDRGAPGGGGLAFATLSFDVAAPGSGGSSEYVLLDGAPSTGYRADPAGTVDPTAWSRSLRDAGVTSLFQSWQTAATDEFAGTDTGYAIHAAVYAFGRASDATAYQAARARNTQAGPPRPADLDPGRLPEGAVVLQRVDSAGHRYDTEVLWVVGDAMYEVLLRLPSRFADPEAALAVAGAERACAEAQDCFGAQPLPAALADDLGPMAYPAPGSVTTRVGTPSAGAGTPAATPRSGPPAATPRSGTPAAGELTTYTSADRGFSLAWDTSVWTRTADFEPFFGVEGIQLIHDSGGVLFIEVRTSRADRTVAGCLADLSDIVLAEEGVDAITPAVDATGAVIAGESDGLALAAYAISFGGDDGLDYFACATLADGESAVGFVYVTSDLATIEEQLADVETVVASYDVG